MKRKLAIGTGIALTAALLALVFRAYDAPEFILRFGTFLGLCG